MKGCYGKLGVDVDKKGIEAFRYSTRSGVYRHAFCDLFQDPEDPERVFAHVTDGDGSKPVQHYLNWKVTGDINSFRGIAQGVLAMNIGDAFTVGVPTSASFVDYVAINGRNVPKKEVLRILAEEWREQFDMLSNYGIHIIFAGGETADLPDQLRTLDVAGALHARYRKNEVITGEAISPGDSIIGIASGGQAVFETIPSGAIMSNGLTLARHVLMRPEFGDQYPEIRDPSNEYTGVYSPTDESINLPCTVGEEITAPTRIFAPIFKGVIERFGSAVHGIVLNTGGGHTKCLRIGQGIRYVKDDFPKLPFIFRLIKSDGHVSGREMYNAFNMGVGADVIADPGAEDEVAQFIEEEFGISSQRIGHCTRARGPNKVRLETPYGNFNHKAEAA